MPLCHTGAKKPHLVLGTGNVLPGSQPAGSALPTGPAGRAPALGPTRGHQIFKHPATAANTSADPGIYSVKRLRVLVFQRLTEQTSQGDRAKRGEEERGGSHQHRPPHPQVPSASGGITLRVPGPSLARAHNATGSGEIRGLRHNRVRMDMLLSARDAQRCTRDAVPVTSQALAQGPALCLLRLSQSATSRGGGQTATMLYVAEGSEWHLGV